MECIIGHEIMTESGFKVFEAGVDYPAEETAGRERYFKAATGETERPTKKGKKLNEEEAI